MDVTDPAPIPADAGVRLRPTVPGATTLALSAPVATASQRIRVGAWAQAHGERRGPNTAMCSD